MEAFRMREINIRIRSLQDAEHFVRLASAQPYRVTVGNDYQNINGKDLMGMFCLDFSEPQRVQMICSQEEFLSFQTSAQAFLA